MDQTQTNNFREYDHKTSFLIDFLGYILYNTYIKKSIKNKKGDLR